MSQKSVMTWINEEEKVHILSVSNQVFSYGCRPGADLQPLINFFRKTEKLPIAEVYIQRVVGQPMEAVTSKYDIGNNENVTIGGIL